MSATTTTILAFVLGCGAGLFYLTQGDTFDAAFPSAESEQAPDSSDGPQLSKRRRPGAAASSGAASDSSVPDPAEAAERFVRGSMNYRAGRISEAIVDLQWVIRHNPQDVAAAHMYGECLLKLEQYPLAALHYGRLAAAHPQDPRAHFGLGWSHEKLQAYSHAIAAYRESLLLKPDQVRASNNLAWLLATAPDAELRDGAEAVRLSQAAEQHHGEPTAWLADTQAAAFAEAGNFPEAMRLQTFAAAAAPRSAREESESRLELYRQGKPFRLGP